MAVVLQHFSHEHPLVLVRRRLVGNDKEENDQQSTICYGCQQPILLLFTTTTTSSSNRPDYCYYYSCNTCTYRLHKKCAELPHGVKHPDHPQHPLTLLAHPPAVQPYQGSCRCNVCEKQEWKWFIYHCAKCRFDAHVTCTPLEERPINKHKFHDHPLTFTQRPASFFCDACGTEGEDLSYHCSNTSCQFWIHDSCASSPNTIKRNDHPLHPLQLTYSIPYPKRKFYHECYICNEAVHPNYWVYYCASCTYFAHLKCGISEEDSSALSDTISIENLDPDVIRFPMLGLMTQFFMNKSLIYNENNRIGCRNGHLEALIDDDVDRKNEMRKKKKEILCDVCVQPISFSSEPLSNCRECSFIAHTRCTLFKSQILHPSHPQHPLSLGHISSTFGIPQCNMCHGYTNGFLFYCSTCRIFVIDVSCAITFLPSKIKHDAHNHPLTLQTLVSTDDGHPQYCKACGKVVDYGMNYACDSSINCDYRLHTNCAKLPGTLEHDWDKHHMSLTYPPFDHPEDYFCETCEEDIHPTHWLYHCSKCDHSFHTNCAHPHDDWSKVKFGITYKFDGHEHDLTLVRRPKKPRPCKICGLQDPNYPRLDCASCSYQMCYFCALYKVKGKRIN